MKVSEDEMTRWLETAKEAALLAGDFLSRRNPSSIKINAESERDVKIAADVESEQRIIKHLKEKSNFPILSEETGKIAGMEDKFTWIIDPLDGSMNYMRGIPICCVSIGLWQKDKPVLGVVYDFNKLEIFSGIAGEGAWLNNVPMKVSKVSSKKKAVLGTGFPVSTDFSNEGVRMFIENVRLYKKLRLLGSAALSIAYVAAGRIDAYYEKDIMLWDVAGGAPILLGAGGRLDMKKATGRYSYNVYVSNAELSKE